MIEIAIVAGDCELQSPVTELILNDSMNFGKRENLHFPMAQENKHNYTLIEHFTTIAFDL